MTSPTTPEQLAALMDAMDYDDTRAAAAMLRTLSAELARTGNNRDMWRGQCERQAEALTTMRAELAQARAELEGLKAQVQEFLGAQKPDCWCQTCRPITLGDMRMVLCPDCGNKRCPKANDHSNDCTGSNEPGQAGSAYPCMPPEVGLSGQQLRALAICQESKRVSVSEVQRKLVIGWKESDALCRSLIAAGVVTGLALAPGLADPPTGEV